MRAQVLREAGGEVKLEALGRRGRLVCLTTFPGVTVDVSPRRMVHDEISIVGSRYAARARSWRRAAAWPRARSARSSRKSCRWRV